MFSLSIKLIFGKQVLNFPCKNKNKVFIFWQERIICGGPRMWSQCWLWAGKRGTPLSTQGTCSLSCEMCEAQGLLLRHAAHQAYPCHLLMAIRVGEKAVVLERLMECTVAFNQHSTSRMENLSIYARLWLSNCGGKRACLELNAALRQNIPFPPPNIVNVRETSYMDL